jgi:hypothetical protein
MLMVGSYLGHYPIDLGEKYPSALDYFPGRFTFKATPPRRVFPVGNKIISG